MREPITISVIIPFFNRADLLLETLQSIKAQTFSDYEVLIVDDGSEEQEARKIINFISQPGNERFTFRPRPSGLRKGANPCRRFGFAQAKGTYIKWFDSDDLMKPDLLEIQINQIGAGYDGVFCNCEIWNGDFSWHIKDGWRKFNFSNTPLQDYLKTQLAWQTGCGLWRADSIRKVEPFSEDITNAQEWIFHLKSITAGLKIGVSNKKLVKIRRHEASISGNRKTKYFINRLQARSLGLLQLLRSQNHGKRYLIKSIVNMIIDQKLYKHMVTYKILLGLLTKSFPVAVKNKKQIVNLQSLND
jgi:glycosyltransferase involved in cell wall biosynthesis